MEAIASERGESSGSFIKYVDAQVAWSAYKMMSARRKSMYLTFSVQQASACLEKSI
jgi:hypothetical protein